MKNLCKASHRSDAKISASLQLFHWFTNGKSLVFLAFLLSLFAFTGCKKLDLIIKQHKGENKNNHFMNTDEEFRKKYKDLDKQNVKELQHVRAASEKYRKIENALKDGYKDIIVDVPNMGHHYMKLDIVNETFDMTKPEILVYNRDHSGTLQLVAVEYAVPIELTPDKAPEGFAGTGDVWDRNIGFGLWLLHAWVWHYNPDGVFNPTNPLVHLH